MGEKGAEDRTTIANAGFLWDKLQEAHQLQLLCVKNALHLLQTSEMA